MNLKMTQFENLKMMELLSVPGSEIKTKKL
jgi:hypothetical protein